MNRSAHLIVVCFLSLTGILLMATGDVKADFTYGEPVNLGPPISQGPHLGSVPGEWSPDISADGLSLYFSSLRTDGQGSADIWVVTRPTVDDPWGEPVNLGPQVNGSRSDADPSISDDGLTLYYGSWRSGGQGNRDIWMSQRASVGNPWGPPVNLGAGINSSESEEHPDISSDGLTLYFHCSRSGNNDIYQATRPSLDTPWTNATVSRVPNINNSETNDGNPCISTDGLSLYFKSNRPGNDADLYVATRPSVNSPWSIPVNLGDTINTVYSEYGPSVSSDGLSLYFCQDGLLFVATRQNLSEPFGTPQTLTNYETSAQISADGLALYFSSISPGGIGYTDDLWVSFRDTLDGPWQEPINLGENVNTDSRENSPTLSLDGLELYFTRITNPSESDLFVSTRATTNDPWGLAVNMGSTVNSPDWDYDPALTTDGLTLIFASSRAGGQGETDLWMTQRNAVGEPWGEPVNFDSPVNTSSYEASPCLSSNGRYLFFLSDRTASGWEDLMLSTLEESENGGRGEKTYAWGEPVNLTKQLDLHEDIWSVSLSPDDGTLYISSCHSRDAKTGLDIWQMEILPILDFNNDGQVDCLDTCDLIDHWDTDNSLYDIGPTPLGDGIVDEQDLLVLIEHMLAETGG